MAANSPMISQLLQLLMATGLGQQLLNSAYNWGTGGNVLGFTPSNYDPTKTVAQNYYNMQQARRSEAMFGAAVDTAVRTTTNNYVRGFYEMLGYNRDAATKRALQGSPLQSLIVDNLLAPKIRQAAGQMQQALYDRQDQWYSGNPKGSKVPYMRAGGALINEVITEASQGGFAGLGVTEVGSVAARMIGIGRFNPHTKGEMAATGQGARIKRFKEELQSYAESINALQDVIEGPVEQIMDSFEKLTGSKMISTASGRVSLIANATRNILSHGVVDEAHLGRITNSQYSMIAPFGGTQMAAAQMALMTGAVLTAGANVEGLSGRQLEDAMTRMNARSLADGSQRKAAGAYAHFVRTHGGKDTDETRAAFMNEINTLGSRYGFQAGLDKYLNTRHVSMAEMYSARATNVMGNPEFTAQLHMSKLTAFERNLQRKLGGRGFEVAKLVRNIQDPAALETELIKNYGATEGQRIADVVKAQARLATGETDEYAAMGLIGSIGRGARILGERRTDAAWAKIGNYSTKGGPEGVLMAIAAKGKSALTIGDAFGAYLGLDSNQISAAIREAGVGLDGKIDKTQMRNVITQLAQSAGVDYKTAAQYLGQIASNRGMGHKIAMLEGKGSSAETIRRKTALLKTMRDARDGKMSIAAAEAALNIATEGNHGLLIDSGTRAEIMYRAVTGKLDGSTVNAGEVEQFTKARDYLYKKAGGSTDELDPKKWEKATKQAAAETQAQSYIKNMRAAARAAGKDISTEELKNDTRLKELYKLSGSKENHDKWLEEMSKDNSIEGLFRRLLDLLEKGIKVESK